MEGKARVVPRPHMHGDDDAAPGLFHTLHPAVPRAGVFAVGAQKFRQRKPLVRVVPINRGVLPELGPHGRGVLPQGARQ